MTPSFRRVAIIYNPASGQHSARRARAVSEVLAVLRAAGVEAQAFETECAGAGTLHAAEAVREGFDAVIACGGDGTVHEVLQSLVGSEVALGVIPLGTANALAANLGLTGAPVKAARKLLDAKPERIPAGRIHYQNGDGNQHSHYFLVAAGVGADALLMSRLDSGLKRRLGYVLYLIEAARIWATHPFPLFTLEMPESENGAARVFEVSQLLAVRVRSFGGALNHLAPGATLLSNNLHLLAFRTRSRLRYAMFLLAVLAGKHTFKREVELVEASSVECRARNGSKEKLFVEADGEVLGWLPARMEMVPQAVNLLIPPGAKP